MGCLKADEIHIRKSIQYVLQKHFLYRGLNVDIGLPMGYLNIYSLNGAQRQSILNQLILELENDGVTVKSVTVDRDPTNIVMAELNGAKIKPKDLNGKVDVQMHIYQE